MKKLFYIIVLLLLFSLVHAEPSDIYPFTNPQLQQRFVQLNQNLRCLVCQNQNLADSSAPLAQDLKQQIYQQLQHGKSDQQIINYLTARYGDFVLFKPPLKASTYVLWFAPALFLFVGFFMLWRYLRE